jgi:hypothetical protein
MNGRLMRCLSMALLCLALAPFITGCGGGGCPEVELSSAEPALDAYGCPLPADATGPGVQPPPPSFCTNNPACI